MEFPPILLKIIHEFVFKKVVTMIYEQLFNVILNIMRSEFKNIFVEYAQSYKRIEYTLQKIKQCRGLSDFFHKLRVRYLNLE